MQLFQLLYYLYLLTCLGRHLDSLVGPARLLVGAADQIPALAWIFLARDQHCLGVPLPFLDCVASTAAGVPCEAPGILGEHLWWQEKEWLLTLQPGEIGVPSSGVTPAAASTVQLGQLRVLAAASMWCYLPWLVCLLVLPSSRLSSPVAW